MLLALDGPGRRHPHWSVVEQHLELFVAREVAAPRFHQGIHALDDDPREPLQALLVPPDQYVVTLLRRASLRWDGRLWAEPLGVSVVVTALHGLGSVLGAVATAGRGLATAV